MKDVKEIRNDAEELTLDVLKKATGGKKDPIINDTKDISDDVKDKV
jgi:hypothetical protein